MPPHPSFTLHSFRKSRRSGIALIIVLAMLVLVSGIVVAFIASATTENRSANIAAQGFEARQAAETATSFVIAQIREATKDGTGDTTWISQPGAIRTIGRNSSDNTVYKLYSSDVMQVAESGYDPGSNLGEAGLDSSGDPSKAVNGYVDLNEPALVAAPGSNPASPTYEARYPIVSPYGKYEFSGNKFNTATEPSTPGGGAVEGFYCKDYKDTARKDANGAAIPLLPMRVKWLYILKDGKIAGTNAAGKIAGATAGNPPVARTAFWVDDESCKLNLNTASEGTYWDTPAVSAAHESGLIGGGGDPSTLPPASLNLAMAQPVRAEYQRFPGHPATTCLSPALRWLFSPATAGDPSDVEFKESIYRLAPKVQETFLNVGSGPDSSRGGTLRGKDAAKARKPDTDRLYASVDEYFFRPDRTPRDQREFTSTHADPPGAGTSKDVAIPSFTPENLETLRFFLTTSSRTPELNLFGKPRATIWPIHNTEKQRSAFDDLFRFCSRVGADPGSASSGFALNFTRADPNSPIVDIGSPQAAPNLALYKYLQNVTKVRIPFLNPSKSFVDKYGEDNRDQTLTSIFDYVRSTNLVDTEQGSHGPYTPTRTDGLAGTPSDGRYPLGFTRFFWKDLETSGTSYASGQVVPLKIGESLKGGKEDTQGFGRFVVPSEIALLFYRVDPQGPNDPVRMQAVILVDMYTLGCAYPGLSERYSVRIQTPGVDPEKNPTGTPVPNISFKVVDIATPASPPKELNFPPDATNIVDCDAYTSPIARMFMPSRGFFNQFLYPTTGWDTTPKRFLPSPTGSPVNENYPFVSQVIEFPKGTREFGLIGGSLTLDIYARPKSTEKPNIGRKDPNRINSVTLLFPDLNDPAPATASKPKRVLPIPGPRVGDSPQMVSSDFKLRTGKGINGSRNDLSGSSSNSGYRWLESGDVIRGMELGGTIAKGDLRLAAAKNEIVQKDTVSYTYYQPRGYNSNVNGYGDKELSPYFDVRNRGVHGLRVSRGGYITVKDDNTVDPNNPIAIFKKTDGITPTGRLHDGMLAKDTESNRRPDRTPKLPPGINGVTMRNGNPGDWDRGISKNVAGAYINRADEGNVNFEPGRGDLGIPYFLGFSGFSEVGPSYFSPNRMISSPVMFGSLPSRAISDTPTGGDPAPWETLLFRPQAFTDEHRGGSESPADHYLLDLFQMPVVEPYAISEPLSSAGKVNLNYVIAPFGYVRPSDAKDGAAYIERKTSLHGIFKPVKMLLVPKTAGQHGHGPDGPSATSGQFRFDIDRTATLKEIENRIKTKGLFRTASEICEVPLYPIGAMGTPTAPASANAWKPFWENYSLTGDSGRERPYSMIYPRVTTKSNVFTAYIRAQSIRKSPGTAADVFDEAKDQVTGEYRGSSTIERFIDPNDSAISAYDPRTGGGLDPYYRFRIVNTKRFSQ